MMPSRRRLNGWKSNPAWEARMDVLAQDEVTAEPPQDSTGPPSPFTENCHFAGYVRTTFEPWAVVHF